MVCVHCGFPKPDDAPACPNCNRAVDAREFVRGIVPGKGVNGWLALFVFILMVLNPLSLCLRFLRLSSVHPWSGTVSPTTLGELANWMALFALACLGMYAGDELRRVTPKAVRMAKVYLLSVGVYWCCTLFVGIAATWLHIASEHELWSRVGDFVDGIVYVAVWYFYLMRSKRVAATYPRATAN